MRQKPSPMRGRWHGEAVTDEVEALASTRRSPPHQSPPATASPHRGSLGRFGETAKKLIRSTNLQLQFSIFFCFSKRKRWRVRNDHGGTSRRKRRLLSSVLISSFPNRKLNLRFGFYCKSATTIPQARSLCHYWYASSLYTREPWRGKHSETRE